ncbi:MAG: hypothetical protein RMY62_004380 [Nostoc sp. ZfuVER08]|nr:hypothetical protein [Nostoc sp. ZfuVER08]
MLGQNYFATRLSDIYEYSRIHYRCGEGVSSENIDYFWELCVDVSGNIIFLLHTKIFTHFLEEIPKIKSFTGTSNDKAWKINCTDIHVLSVEAKIPNKLTYFCIPSIVNLEKQRNDVNVFNYAKAYFTNFEFSSIESDRGLVVNINGKDFCFQMIDKCKIIIDFLKRERINNALISTVTISFNSGESIKEIEDEIKSISWFLSLLNINGTFTPVIEYSDGNDVVKFSIENTVKNNFHRNCIIDNLLIEEGIMNAFIECYQNYKNWQKNSDINTLISFMVEINQQKYIDIKLATMLMAYEYLLFKYLLNQGLTQNEIGDNIQQKLKQANKYLRFIPSKMMDETLRGSVRNPLFHQGEIPRLQSNEKIEIFKQYYNLMIKIVLKILGYTGEYISIITHKPSKT